MAEMTAPPVHPGTPTAEADLFADEATVAMQLSGVLMHDAQVRDKAVGDGEHFAPVLCLEVQPLRGGGHTFVVQQVYSEATRALAVQRAQALRRGTRISFTTPLAGMRVFLPHVQTITTEG